MICELKSTKLNSSMEGSRGVMVNSMGCGIIVSEFEHRSCYYVHFQTNNFGKDVNPLMLPAVG